MKNSAVPATLISAPVNSVTVIFSLYIRTAGIIINMGTSAMMVDAMPVPVCLTDIREKEMPRNGPKKAPKVSAFMAATSRVALRV